MLAHPFFGLQNHKLFAYAIENRNFIFAIFESKRKLRKIKCLQYGVFVFSKLRFNNQLPNFKSINIEIWNF